MPHNADQRHERHAEMAKAVEQAEMNEDAEEGRPYAHTAERRVWPLLSDAEKAELLKQAARFISEFERDSEVGDAAPDDATA